MLYGQRAQSPPLRATDQSDSREQHQLGFGSWALQVPLHEQYPFWQQLYGPGISPHFREFRENQAEDTLDESDDTCALDKQPRIPWQFQVSSLSGVSSSSQSSGVHVPALGDKSDEASIHPIEQQATQEPGGPQPDHTPQPDHPPPPDHPPQPDPTPQRQPTDYVNLPLKSSSRQHSGPSSKPQPSDPRKLLPIHMMSCSSVRVGGK